MNYDIKSAARPDYDQVIAEIADYALNPKFDDYQLAMDTAQLSFYDALGCASLALNFEQCTKLLGPIVPGAELKNGVKILGSAYQLEPVRAAFNIGTMIRWLDFNDTWLAAEWGHPSDNLGGIWAVAEYLSRANQKSGAKPFLIKDLLEAMIVAYEVQGVIALKNSFNAVGIDHVILVRLGTTAAIARMLGLNKEQTRAAISNAWLDGSALRTYRHAPNAGSRKSWAAGDATSRAVFLALVAKTGEMGYPSALTAKKWGFQDSSFRENEIVLERKLGSYVMENILFKVSYPAEFHAQTAVECALELYPQVKGKEGEIEQILIETQSAGARIIDKTGKLNNPADRDHCLQYMVAIPLIKGSLTAEDYEDSAAANPLIDQLRAKMVVTENQEMSKDYLLPEKRAIGNSLTIKFKDGSQISKRVDYPIGHKRRRQDSIKLLQQKFSQNMESQFSPDLVKKLEQIVFDHQKLCNTQITEFSDLLFKG